MKNKTYDILKVIGAIAPIIVGALIEIFDVWNVPYTVQISATLSIIVGAYNAGLLKVSSDYHKSIDVATEEE